MKTEKMLYLVIVLLAWPSAAYPQDPLSAVLTWHATEVTDLQTNVTKPSVCQFVTKPGKTVEWIQKEGSRTTTFAITGITGSWESVAQFGQVEYALQRNGKSSTMKLERSANGLFVTMDFSQPGQFTSVLRFRIKSIE